MVAYIVGWLLNICYYEKSEPVNYFADTIYDEVRDYITTDVEDILSALHTGYTI